MTNRHCKANDVVAPQTRFQTRISAHRRVAFGSLSLADVKAIKNTFGCTVNDVVLALVASGLRSWLDERAELPARPLAGFIPMSVRTRAVKERHSALPASLLLDANHFIPPALFAQAARATSRLAGVHGINQPANVMISNVPSPSTPMYLWQPMIERNLRRLRSGVTGQPHMRNLDRWELLVKHDDHTRGSPPISNLRGEVATATAEALGL